MHKFLRTMTTAAVAAAMAPAFAADATYNVDVVVVGAGAAGTAAGWAAAEKGLKVVTLEKQAMVGGTGKFSEGIFAVESSMQRNWNYGLTKDEAFQKIMNYGHWRGNAKMVRAFVDKSGETIDWMQANGVKFEKLFSNYHPPTKGIWGDGIVVQDTCRQCAHPTPCANACPQGAIVVDPKTGARRVDKEKCIGCHLCEKACPWGMMTFDVEEKKASKCFLCDGEPKCVKHCPAAAIRYVPWMDRTGDEPRQSIHGYLPQENRDQCSICHR